MTFDPTKPVRTRDGRPARILAADVKDPDGRAIVAAISRNDSKEELYTFQANGRYSLEFTNPRDLVNIPKERSSFVNLYAKGNDRYRRGIGETDNHSLDYARTRQGSSCTGTLEIVVDEDGKFIRTVEHPLP